MKAKRFPGWSPKVGERALVPGNPANAAYVSELTADDVKSIEAGHRGYTPLRLLLTDRVESHNEFRVIVHFDERSGVWTTERFGMFTGSLKHVLAWCTKYSGRRIYAQAVEVS